MRGLLFGMFAMSLPNQVPRPHMNVSPPEAFVSTSEDFPPLPAAIAYNDVMPRPPTCTNLIPI